MTDDVQAERPHDVPVAVWDWIVANLPTVPPFVVERPLVTVVLTSLHQDKNEKGPTPDDVLCGWSSMIDTGRRALNQSERAFIEQARAAGWDDDRIRNALLHPPDVDLDARIDELNTMVYSRERPGSAR